MSNSRKKLENYLLDRQEPLKEKQMCDRCQESLNNNTFSLRRAHFKLVLGITPLSWSQLQWILGMGLSACQWVSCLPKYKQFSELLVEGEWPLLQEVVHLIRTSMTYLQMPLVCYQELFWARQRKLTSDGFLFHLNGNSWYFFSINIIETLQ